MGAAGKVEGRTCPAPTGQPPLLQGSMLASTRGRMQASAVTAPRPIVACSADYDKLNQSAKSAFEKDIFAAEAAQLNGKAISEFKRKFIIV